MICNDDEPKKELAPEPPPEPAWIVNLRASHDRLLDALQATEATLAMCKGKLPAYAENRRAETIKIVREALKKTEAT
jgi:hypothetical protein